MSEQWFYTDAAQQQQGPVTADELRQLAARGHLGRGSLVWTAGMPQWAPADSVPQLAGAFAPIAGAPGYQPAAGAAGQPVPGYPAQLGYGVAPSYYNQHYAEYAGFWLRFCAAFVDGIILWIPFAILQTLFAPNLRALPPGTPPPASYFAVLGALNLVQILAYWLYFALQESSSYQATLGKRAVGILVTDINGQRLTFARATGRHFGKIVSALICWIGFIMAAFTQQKQALHDIMASTLVVRKRPGA